MKYIDLHVHSNRSDGTDSPAELVKRAAARGLSAVALTDHDTVNGIEEAIQAAKLESQAGRSIQIIPGIEISAGYKQRDIHILGLFIQWNNLDLKNALEIAIQSRERRNEEMVSRLRKAGISITIDDLRNQEPDTVITRAHFARMLMKKGYVGSYREAFDRFLGDGKPCYVEREKITPKEAIELIHQAKGLAILTHPLLYHMGEQELKKLIVQCKSDGLDGLEAIYSMNNGAEERQMKELAAEFGLAISGGSDFQGATKPHIDLGVGRGNLLIPEEVLLNLKKLLYNGI